MWLAALGVEARAVTTPAAGSPRLVTSLVAPSITAHHPALVRATAPTGRVTAAARVERGVGPGGGRPSGRVHTSTLSELRTRLRRSIWSSRSKPRCPQPGCQLDPPRRHVVSGLNA